MDQIQFFKAFLIWKNRYGHSEINESVLAYNEIRPPKLNLKSAGWIRRAREAQFLSLDTAARKARISKQAWNQLEQSESSGKITLESLRKAAEALDCELVYGFRTKSRRSFALQIWHQILKDALKIYKRRMRTNEIKPMFLANFAEKLMRDQEFRKKQGWLKNQPR